MIRLCIIATIPTTIKAFFGEQLRFLRDNSFDVTVITSPMSENDNKFGRSLPENIKYKPVQISRTIKPWEDVKAFSKILWILRKGRFDIVQYVTPKAAFMGSVASWLVRTPVRLYLLWGL